MISDLTLDFTNAVDMKKIATPTQATSTGGSRENARLHPGLL